MQTTGRFLWRKFVILREELVHGLWVAEGENTVHPQVMQPLVDKGKPNTHIKRRRCIAIAIVLVLIAVGGVVLGVVLSRPGNGGDTGLEVELLIQSATFDGGESLNDTSSLQSKAISWLKSNTNIKDYPDWQRIQRFAVVTLKNIAQMATIGMRIACG